MVKDPNLFKPGRKDFGAHDHKYGKSPWEWWYFDVRFDNGYSLVSIWFAPVTPTVRAPYGCISLDLADPKGTLTTTQLAFEQKDVSVSHDHCDVVEGDNYVRGEWPRYELHADHGDAVLDLVFESQTQGVMEPPDGCFIGRDLPPAASSRYMGWVISMPRARVTGTLSLAGNRIAVSGVGYHDHQWGSVQLVDGLFSDGFFYDYWYWGRIYLGEYTLVYWDGQLRPELGSQRFKKLVVLKGEKLVEYLTDGIYTDVNDTETDSVTGIEYHRTTTLIIESETINGKVIQRPTQDLGRWLFPPRAGYVRYGCDCEAGLELFGKKVAEAKGQSINELIFLNNRE